MALAAQPLLLGLGKNPAYSGGSNEIFLTLSSFFFFAGRTTPCFSVLREAKRNHRMAVGYDDVDFALISILRSY